MTSFRFMHAADIHLDSPVTDHNLARMLAVANAHTTTVMKTHPTRTTGDIQCKVDQGPVTYCIGTIEHVFSFAVGACNASAIKVISTDDDWG